ncbi:SAM-dependent methyltransferase, partial [Haematococcus lacustris]
MGSHGCKAVALALMGAQVSVVDVAPGNKHYAEEVAAAAGVTLRYEVCDVLQLPGSAPDLLGLQDLVLLENGILHYFTDLQALYKVVRALLVPGRGRLVLRDFHPVSTKLITNKSGKLKLSSHLPQQAALTSYNSGTAPRAPCGRFGHADAVYNDTLYMYGGHDGGFSRHGQQNYIPGHEFEELWAMELDTKRWRLLHASLPDDQPGPGK